MGCPDWPKCFGNFIPPTSIEQLPQDYKEKYVALREKKNIRFAKYLAAFGFKETANRILNDKSILIETDFNPVKTWIEYANRLVGVIIGFFIIALTWQSRKFRKTDPEIFSTSVFILILVIFQGWFGSIVVSTNLATWTITLHMFLALLMVLLLVSLQSKTENINIPTLKKAPAYAKAPAGKAQNKTLIMLTIAGLVTLFVQVFLGTEVRAAVDLVSARLPRAEWIGALGSVFVTHRTFSWLVLILQAVLIVKIRKTQGVNSLSLPLIILILCTFLTGVGMAYLKIPALLQPLHLTIATIAVGTEALLMFRLIKTNGGNRSTSGI
jgi:cytochrome c oxidase assembly protein subunit 15